LHDFIDMAGKITAIKERNMAPTRENVDRFLSGIRRLKERDQSRYEWVRERARKELFTGPAQEANL